MKRRIRLVSPFPGRRAKNSVWWRPAGGSHSKQCCSCSGPCRPPEDSYPNRRTIWTLWRLWRHPRSQSNWTTTSRSSSPHAEPPPRNCFDDRSRRSDSRSTAEPLSTSPFPRWRGYSNRWSGTGCRRWHGSDRTLATTIRDTCCRSWPSEKRRGGERSSPHGTACPCSPTGKSTLRRFCPAPRVGGRHRMRPQNSLITKKYYFIL